MKKTIAFITDSHLAEELPVAADQQRNFDRILEDIEKRGVDQVIIGGDIGHESIYADFFKSLGKYSDNLKVIPGNHDSLGDLLSHFPNPEFPDLAELYYSYSDDNFLYIFLDSSTDEFSNPQLAWLREKVEETNLKILLFVHHPIFEIDTPVDRKYPLQNREIVQQILMQQQREIFVFCGHYHTEDETGTGAISQYETTAVSYQIRKGTPDVEPHADYFGYRLITLDNGNVATELIKLQP
ncbi:MAG: metallophosphoesterase [Flavobacterium sp.]|uniref:metallophosphoesterase family protein n=1 Tax=Flavobacterium sp. TaxID=239 RepID=UPI001220DB37|nr:metallophosphoesterase [Flavobacterium sp.]RZJ66937.1 MAG: metallophosphoesterase [Flavobacterium sp.]